MNGSEWEAFCCSWSIPSSWAVTVNGREFGVTEKQKSTCYQTHSSPCWVQEQRDPEHRPPRSHSFFRTFAKENHSHLTSAAERHCQRVGSSFKRREISCTFYILHYLWLCTSCWYPDDGVHVWNIWYLAFSRGHQMKCNSQIYLCLSLQIHPVVLSPPTQPRIWSLTKMRLFWSNDSSRVNAKSLSEQTQHNHINRATGSAVFFHWRQ